MIIKIIISNAVSIFRRLLALRQGVSWFVILTVALGLRLISLDQSLWLDEAIQWWAVTSFDLRELLTGYMVGDFNPPGHHVLMWFWVRMFGESEVALRMPSVIFGVGIVWWVYKIGKIISEGDEGNGGDKGNRGNRGDLGVWAAGMAAVNGLLIYYSQEARMYAAAAFFVSGAMYFFIRGDRGKRGNLGYWGYLGFMAAALYSHYLTWLMLPFLAIWGLRYVLPVLVTVPWWPMFFKQLQAGMAAAGNPVWADLSRTNFKNLALVAVKFVTGRVPWPDGWGQIGVGVIVFGFWMIIFIGVIRVIGPSTRFTLRRRPPASRSQRASVRGSGVPAEFSLLRKFRIRPNFWLIITMWAFGPVVLGSLIGLVIPVFTYFRFLFAVPPILVLMALGASRLVEWGRWGIVGVMGVFSLIYLFNSDFHREDWRRAVGELRRMDEMPVVIIHPAVRPPFDYYDKGSSTVIVERSDLPRSDLGRSDLMKPSIWYIPYAQAIFDPEDTVRKELSGLGYVRGYERHFRGVTLEKWVNYESIAREVF